MSRMLLQQVALVGLVTASCGGSGAAPTNIAGPPAAVRISFSPALGVANVTAFSFTASVLGASEDSIKYDWAFPDGTTATGRTVSKPFSIDGDLKVVVTAANSSGVVSQSVAVPVATMTGQWKAESGVQTLTADQVNDTFTGSFVAGSIFLDLARYRISPADPGHIDATGRFHVTFSTSSHRPQMNGHFTSSGALEYQMDGDPPFLPPQSGRLVKVSTTP